MRRVTMTHLLNLFTKPDSPMLPVFASMVIGLNFDSKTVSTAVIRGYAIGLLSIKYSASYSSLVMKKTKTDTPNKRTSCSTSSGNARMALKTRS